MESDKVPEAIQYHHHPSLFATIPGDRFYHFAVIQGIKTLVSSFGLRGYHLVMSYVYVYETLKAAQFHVRYPRVFDICIEDAPVLGYSTSILCFIFSDFSDRIIEYVRCECLIGSLGITID